MNSTEQDKFQAATDIAIEAGVLERCEFCDITVYQGDEEIDEAYKLGKFKLSRGEFGNFFTSSEEIMKAIKDAVESGDNAGDRCYHCHEKMFGDD